MPSRFPRRMPLAIVFAICAILYLFTRWRKNTFVGLPSRPIFTPGEVNYSHNYQKALILASVKGENTSWVAAELPDVEAFIYVNNDPTAKLTVPVNKGNEAMTYLTFLIDHYHHLPEIMIFAHAHRTAYHNPWVLGKDMVQMVRALNPYRVVRHGYMNLHPGDGNNKCWAKTRPSEGKPHEETQTSWKELFPQHEVPSALAQMPGAQFAVSRERVRQVPLQDLKHYQKWLMNTPMSNKLSGFVFEMLWQFIFRGEYLHCPDALHTYCDGYAICFDGEAAYDEFDKAFVTMEGLERQVEFLNELEARYFTLSQADIDKRTRMSWAVQDIKADLDRRRDEAIVRGYDPKIRAEAAAYV